MNRKAEIVERLSAVWRGAYKLVCEHYRLNYIARMGEWLNGNDFDINASVNDAVQNSIRHDEQG